jgi:hypothetical protein
MTIGQQIKELEAAALRIEHNPDNIEGGKQAYYSGRQTHLKPAAQRKLDKINRQLDALFDQCEA